MSWFPQPSSPRAAFRDLIAFMSHTSREQRIGAALAVLVTSIIVIEFIVDTHMGLDPTPTPTYVELYAANRSDADIIAEQKKEEADKAAAEKEKQRQFRELGKRLGID